MRAKIKLDTMEDVEKVVKVAAAIDRAKKITITDNNGLIVNARSLLGVIYSKMEFAEIWIDSEVDLYTELRDLIV